MSLAATVIQSIRVKNPDFDKNEHRLSQYGALDFFYAQSMSAPLLSKEMKEQAIKSAGKTLQIPVINYDGNVQVSNQRTCVIADAENTSALATVTFVTYAVGFTMVPAMYSNNEIGYEQDFTAKLKKVARALGAALDTAAIAKLEAAKTQLLAETLIYTQAAGVVAVPFTERENILGDIEPMMNANDFYGQVHIVGNAGVAALVKKLAEKGLYNEVNKNYEWENKIFHFTNRLANEDGNYGTFYAVEEGNVDMLFRYDREAVRGASANGHEWDIVNMPYINIPVGLHFYTEVGNQSAIAGDATADLTCGVKEFYGFSVDVAFVTSYNSNLAGRANPIIKAEIARGATTATPVVISNTEDNPVFVQDVQ